MTENENPQVPETETPESPPEKKKTLLEKIRARAILTGIGMIIAVIVITIGIIFGGLLTNTILPAGDIGDFFPEPEGYNRTNVLVNAVTEAVRTVADWRGFDAVASNIDKFETYVNCYREEGVFDARLYASNFSPVEGSDTPPAAGLLLIVNPERAESLGGCDQGFTQQSLQIDPCYGYGNFNTDEQETISFIFVATDNSLCLTFADHFNQNYGASTIVGGLFNNR